MKKLLQNYLKVFLFLTIAFAKFNSSNAQTPLTIGDIAFTGYHGTLNAPDDDAFSFVLLKNIAANTVLNFTDNAWGNNSLFRAGEQTLTITFNSALVAGREIHVFGDPNGTPSANIVGGGLLTISGSMLSLSVNGDQVFAYQGMEASPTFVGAIHMNVYSGSPDPSTTDATNWDNLASTAHTANSSFKPAGFTTGTNALWIGTQGLNSSERNNARFNPSLATAGGANLLTVAGLRAALNNQAYWNAEFAATGATPTWSLPTGYDYLAATAPVFLHSFETTLQKGNISKLTWKVVDQQNIKKYIIQKSTDGFIFSQVGEVLANNQPTFNYQFVDELTSPDYTYYRLQIVELGGSISYSKIIKIKRSESKKINVFAVNNTLFVKLSNMINSPRYAVVFNSYGSLVKKMTIRNKQEEINIENLTQGIYYLRIEGGDTHRFLKK